MKEYSFLQKILSHGAEEGRPEREAQKEENMKKLEIEKPEEFGIKNKGLLVNMAEEHGIGDLLGYSFRTNKIEVIGTDKILLIDYDLKPLHTRDIFDIDLSSAELGEEEPSEEEGEEQEEQSEEEVESAFHSATPEKIKEALHQAKVAYEEGIRYYDEKHDTLSPSSYAENIMEHISDLIGYHGIEAYDPEDSNPSHPKYLYINSGDTYGLTVIYDSNKRVFLLGDIGSIIESEEQYSEEEEE